MKNAEALQLGKWESALKHELDDLRKRRNEIESQFQRVSKRLELIRQMRALDEAPEQPVSPPDSPASEAKPTPSTVREMTKRILIDTGRPLHISEIFREFTNRGYPIPGRGTPFNVLAHLVNDKSFVRVARGTYALAGTVPQESVLPKAPRRHRRARRREKHTSNLAEGKS